MKHCSRSAVFVCLFGFVANAVAGDGPVPIEVSAYKDTIRIHPNAQRTTLIAAAVYGALTGKIAPTTP